jgi:hypothetical protein
VGGVVANSARRVVTGGRGQRPDRGGHDAGLTIARLTIARLTIARL